MEKLVNHLIEAGLTSKNTSIKNGCVYDWNGSQLNFLSLSRDISNWGMKMKANIKKYQEMTSPFRRNFREEIHFVKTDLDRQGLPALYYYEEIYGGLSSPPVITLKATHVGYTTLTLVEEDYIQEIVKYYLSIVKKLEEASKPPKVFYIKKEDRFTITKWACDTGQYLGDVKNLSFTRIENGDEFKIGGSNLDVATTFKKFKVPEGAVLEDVSSSSEWFMRPKGGFSGVSHDFFHYKKVGEVNE